jgi:putative nucleotidyltransferase with HDIG domain
MSITARLFVFLIIATGTFAAAVGVVNWTSTDVVSFGTCFLLCFITSLLRVVLPGIQGNFSLSYVLLVWGIAHLGLGETILIGTVSAVVQSYWRCVRKPQPVQLAFNVALIWLSVSLGSLVFSSGLIQSLTPNTVVRIVLASGTYFLVNTSGVSTIIALTEARSVWIIWRDSYLWTFPHYLLAASIVVAVEALRNSFGTEILLLVLPAVYLVFHTLQVHIRGLNQVIERAELEKRHAEATANLHLRTIRSLALAIEAKDKTTGEHLHRVQTYALGLGADLGLSVEQLEALRAAAILHDIGKIAVPEHIISKPGKLTPEEFAKMKVHPVVGAEIVESVHFPFAVAPLVRAHHEKWDGTGYPDGLRGEEIPLGARILTAVDCLDALASDRQYRKAMSLERAMAIVRAESGKSFDPRVVEALSRRCEELEHLARTTLEATANVELSSDLTVERGAAPDAGFASHRSDRDGKSGVCLESTAVETSLIDAVRIELDRLHPLQDTLAAIEPPLHRLVSFDCLALFRNNGKTLSCLYAKGASADVMSRLSIPMGVGVSGWVCANGRPLLNGNALTEFGVSGSVPRDFHLKAALSLTLDSEHGSTWVLTLYSARADAFSTDHLRALLAIKSALSYYLGLNALGIMLPLSRPIVSEIPGPQKLVAVA